MAHLKHYSPQLNRFLVCVLYHEARKQKKPMTTVTSSLLEKALKGSESWAQAEAAMALKESAPDYRSA
jgi:hypothetical protein